MMNDTFAAYRRKQTAELRPYQAGEILDTRVSVSVADREKGCPKVGDMIARNPLDHGDMWLVEAEYFERNFEAARQGAHRRDPPTCLQVSHQTDCSR